MTTTVSSLPIQIKIESAAEILIAKMVAAGMTMADMETLATSEDAWEWAKELIATGESLTVEV